MRKCEIMYAPVSLVARNLVSTLENRRLFLGLGQAQLASKMGISRSAISEWETERHSPSLTSLILWARELDFMVRLVSYEGRPSTGILAAYGKTDMAPQNQRLLHMSPAKRCA